METTQWQKRVKIFEFIYSFLIQDYDKSLIVNNFLDENPNFDASFVQVLEYISKNLDDIINKIKPLLNETWSWNRISYVDRSILICAIAEYESIHTDKKIIIDQSLITARNYNIDDSYKYINPILEKVMK